MQTAIERLDQRLIQLAVDNAVTQKCEVQADGSVLADGRPVREVAREELTDKPFFVTASPGERPQTATFDIDDIKPGMPPAAAAKAREAIPGVLKQAW
jgi:hypothetical protein